MFPEKSGGLALYAHEAWRKYTTLVGPIATFGYWIGWSVVLAVNGLFIGSDHPGRLVPGRAEGGSYLADVTGYFSTGGGRGRAAAADRDRPHPRVWLFNVFGCPRRRHVRLRSPASC